MLEHSPGSLHSAFQLPQLGCDVVLELEALLLEPFEHLVGGRFFLPLNAMDLSIDLIVAGRKLSKLIIALFVSRAMNNASPGNSSCSSWGMRIGMITSFCHTMFSQSSETHACIALN